MQELNIIDYKVSQRFQLTDVPFAAIIAAAMRKADTDNLRALESAFPGIAKDLRARYNAPGGFLGDEAETVNPEQLEAIVNDYYPIR